MDILELLGLSAGVGFLAGIRLYATVLAAGLAIRFHWITVGANQEQWSILAHPVVMISAGALAAVELLADKIPWLDSVWDAFHTFIRPIGAALLGAAAFAQVDPTYRVILILLCGGMALTSHASKAATRFAVNHSPEPFSNIVISTAEDLLMPAGMWLTVAHPLVTLGLACVFLICFAWMSRKIFGFLRKRFGWGQVPSAV
jgi:hypothetical protein